MRQPPRPGASAPLARPPRARAAGRGQPVARLAASQLRRMRAIVDAAVALAEKGGFEAVRLRDVAEASGVALGTLYKYFRSKEDILLFAVHEEAEKLEAVMAARPARGATRDGARGALLRAGHARLHAAAEPGARGDPLDRGERARPGSRRWRPSTCAWSG